MKIWQKGAALVVAGTMVGSAGVAWGAQAAVRAATRPAVAPRDLGDGVSESKYVAITPCRIVDTRKAGGALAAGEARSFRVRGGGSQFAQQGGKAGGCGIPANADAVEAAVSVVDPTGSGYLRTWPAGQAQPTATFVNYAGSSTTNTGAISLCNELACTKDVSAEAFAHGTDLVIDVQGYFITPMAAEVGTNGTILLSSRATGASKLSTGRYRVDFDRDIHLCAMSATGFSGAVTYANVSNLASHADSADVRLYDAAGALEDSVFYVEITC